MPDLLKSLLRRLQQIACNHQWGWNERRGKEVCYRCGAQRPEQPR